MILFSSHFFVTYFLYTKRMKLLNHSRLLIHDGKRTIESKSNSCTLITVENIKAKNLTNTLQNKEFVRINFQVFSVESGLN